eukprot:SAG31_NODE_1419_length_8430_cov_2.658024_2_plen_204_part_00
MSETAVAAESLAPPTWVAEAIGRGDCPIKKQYLVQRQLQNEKHQRPAQTTKATGELPTELRVQSADQTLLPVGEVKVVPLAKLGFTKVRQLCRHLEQELNSFHPFRLLHDGGVVCEATGGLASVQNGAVLEIMRIENNGGRSRGTKRSGLATVGTAVSSDAAEPDEGEGAEPDGAKRRKGQSMRQRRVEQRKELAEGGKGAQR